MKRYFPIFLILAALMAAPTPEGYAQSVLMNVYTSEQELFEAYLMGDIDYQTYQNLVELLESGVDSTEAYLFEELPGYYRFSAAGEEDSNFSADETDPFAANQLNSGREGFIRYREQAVLDESGDRKGIFQLKTRLREGWVAEGILKERGDGRYIWSRRSLVYHPDAGPVRRIMIGNFRARFGLGVSIGYRGVLLGKEDLRVTETLLAPVYGGFNGIYAEAGRRQERMRLLIHFDRNGTFSQRLGALSLSRKYRRFTGEMILLGSQLQNRAAETEFDHYQLGGQLKYENKLISSAVELAYQQNSRYLFPALVWESTIRSRPLRLNLSAWHYSEDYINLAGGGRSGLMYETIAIDTLDFELLDRRHDQSGFLMKTLATLPSGGEQTLSVSFYGKDRYHRAAWIESAMELPLSQSGRIRGVFAYREENRPAILKRENRFRLEYLEAKAKYSLRSYIGFRKDNEGREFFSGFLRLKAVIGSLGLGELWLNLDRINAHTGRVEYMYGYIQETIRLAKPFELSAKYAYRYNYNSSDKRVATFFVESRWLW